MRLLELLRPTNLTYFGLAVIGLGIAVIKIFPIWYPGLAPIGFGIAILIFDSWCKYQILKYMDEQMKPINDLKDKIINDIENYNPDEKPKTEKVE